MDILPVLGFEWLLLAFLILLNGMLTMAETSIVSSRKSMLQKLTQDGDVGARAALQLAHKPNDLLSTIKTFTTLVGFAIGVFAGFRLITHVREFLSPLQLSEFFSISVSTTVVVLLLTFFAVIFAELVPKRIGSYAPENVARYVARPVLFLARASTPFVRLLSRFTDSICALFGIRNDDIPAAISGEDLKSLLQQSAQTGAFDPTEKRMVEGVLEFSEARVSSFMTPRPEVIWLDIDDPAEKNRRKIVEARHSHFPVVKGSPDNVVGVIHVKDILGRQLLGLPFDLTLSLEQALFLPENADASRIVDLFRNSATHFAFVVDEYGNIQGVVTLTDILRAIVGDFADTMDDKDSAIVQRKDGSWLVDGLVSVTELREKLSLPHLRGEDSGNFHTIAGFILSELGKIPQPADSFECDGVRYEVIDMDGNRVDKVLVTIGNKS
ncbi:HlyC/CorC family transporter [bacterium]|nr:HlyC/CorC family transporter [bacterium]